MLLRQMEYACAVARCGSFSRAADACFVSQSAVSQQVRALEDELGCELFVREGRGVVPTAAGERFCRRAQDILRRSRALEREVVRMGAEEGVRLRLGVSSALAGTEAVRAVAAFSREHPAVRVEVTFGCHDALYEGMLDGSLDAAVNDRRRELSDTFHNVRVFPALRQVELPAHDAPEGAVPLASLASGTCLVVAQGRSRAAELAFYGDTLALPCDLAVVPTVAEGRMRVAAGKGVLLVDAAADEGDPVPGTLARRPLAGGAGELACDYYVFWPRRQEGSLPGALAACFR